MKKRDDKDRLAGSDETVESPADVMRVAEKVLQLIHKETQKADKAAAVLATAKEALQPFRGSFS